LKTRGIENSKTGAFFAAYLLSERSVHASRSTFLEFRPEFIPAIRELLDSLIRWSPLNQLLFTSDYQFGPKRPYRSAPLILDEFWALHDSRTLRLNSAYPIAGHNVSQR
jgi:hypothetical protein